MLLPLSLSTRPRLPLIGAPMFLASTPRLLAAQCRSGIVGAMPALNARSTDLLDDWLAKLAALLGPRAQAAPRSEYAAGAGSGRPV